jgi:hypothetical protein
MIRISLFPFFPFFHQSSLSFLLSVGPSVGIFVSVGFSEGLRFDVDVPFLYFPLQKASEHFFFLENERNIISSDLRHLPLCWNSLDIQGNEIYSCNEIEIIHYPSFPNLYWLIQYRVGTKKKVFIALKKFTHAAHCTSVTSKTMKDYATFFFYLKMLLFYFYFKDLMRLLL